MIRTGNAPVLILLLIATGLFAQSDVPLNYRNKPLTPEALKPFFPDMEDSSGKQVVDLNAPFTRPVVQDTGLWLHSRSEKWYSVNLADGDFSGFVKYLVLAKVKDKYIVLAYLNWGGTFTQGLVFFLTLKDDKLYKVGGFETPNVRDFDITIKGDEVIYRSRHYRVPG